MPYFVLEDAALKRIHNVEAEGFDEALMKAAEAVGEELTFEGDNDSPYWLLKELRNEKAEWVEPARPVYRVR